MDQKTRSFLKLTAVAIMFFCALGIAAECRAEFITLQNATATYSQYGGGVNLVGEAIDGDFGTRNGWSIFENPDTVSPNSTHAQTAVFETASNLGNAGGTSLTFKLHQLFYPNAANGRHTLGRFRLSATTDDRAEFADGLNTGGDVIANWTILAPTSVASANGATLTVLGDNSILASGFSPETDVYTVTALTLLTGITGFRLEAMEDDSLPDAGPGRFDQGNFTLTEFEVNAEAINAVPEPASIALLGLASIGGLGLRCRQRRRATLVK